MTTDTQWDCILAAFILSGGTRYSEADLLTHYGVDSLTEVRKLQEEAFADMPEMNMLFKSIDLPVRDIVRRMHHYGVLVDPERFDTVRSELGVKRDTLIRRITDRLGPINPNSPRQLGDALVDKLGLKLTKTATGQYGTRSEDLAKHASTHPVVQDIMDHRAVDKIITTYIDAIVSKIDREHRIHPTYDLTSAATGRIASSDPNIQSTPIGKPYGDRIRGCFIAPTGGVLLGFDYSQQELRILAHLSGDTALCAAFVDGRDVHEITASKVFDIPLEKVTPELRAVGKTLNFGIIYGETPYGLSRQLDRSVEDCAHILKSFYDTYPGIRRYFDNILTSAKINGSVETICGRRRGIPGLPLGKSAKYIAPAQERVLKNFPIQGSAADMTKKGMVAIADHVLPRHPDAHLTMQIHDELIFEYDSNDMKKVNAFALEVHDAMISALPLDVPIVVDWMSGENWAMLK